MKATELLRPGLLQGASLLLAAPPAPLGAAVERAFCELGARVSTCLPDGEDEAAIDTAVAAALADAGSIDMLVVDGGGLFNHDASTALRACLDSAWNVTRAVVNIAFLPAGRGGRIVYFAPAVDVGEHALAARAGLENLARTLSVEWARHHINVITVAAGGESGGRRRADGQGRNTSAEDELAALAAYLASPAGAYFSGCLLDLDSTR
ncbi:MAG TPA: SDR family oxidoreductase [Solirubrobacteraceae bacterium]|jgi:NAD(P)-dependent dehydrogenase (short-subunit alcohol dehydrogenase family)|nr:SDR family oxidoreductase [Solirubrobacteraceae bacterium]